MSDLKMKFISNNDLKLKMKTNEKISMKFDDYQKFKEEDPIFKNSPAYKITNQDIINWNNKSDFDGNYDNLYNKPNLSIYATTSFVNSGLSNKVDKEEGMGLSQNSFTTEEKNKLASLENYDDTAIIEALNDKADISSVPTKTSDLDNDSGFITKNVDDLTNYPTNNSVNAALGGKQNIIDSNNKLSADLVDDTTSANKFVTANDITTWNNKSDFSGSYNDLTNKPTIPTDTSDLTNNAGFITKNVNDLTNYTLSSSLSSVATSGSYVDLSNKPTIPVVDSSVSTSSTNAVENQAITTYVDNLKPVSLFTSSAGEDGEVTLSDSSANYTYLEIYYKQQDGTYSYTKVYDPNGKTVDLIVFHLTNNGYAIGISSRNVTISGNKITTQTNNRYLTINIVSNNTLSGGGNNNKIYITKVVGYK